MANKVGRPTKYNDEILVKTREYIDSCEDEQFDYHKTVGEKSDSYEYRIKVHLPTIEGLALHLQVNKDTVQLWKREHAEFSALIEDLMHKQAKMLVEKGLSGDYNPTIAKVLLTKHGYREGIEATGKDGDKLFESSVNTLTNAQLERLIKEKGDGRTS